jgi:hypothetical protein
MKKVLVVCIGISAFLLMADGAEARRSGRPALKANLTAAANIPPGPEGATGFAKVFIEADRGQVCHTITYRRTQGPLTSGHIHAGRKGVVGPIVVTLQVLPSGETGCVSAEPAVLRAIVNDPAAYYVNLHTEKFPDGVLRGQLHR